MNDELVTWVQAELSARAEPANVAPMAAYMKTSMPFYGVKRPDRRPVERELVRRFRAPDRETYEAAVARPGPARFWLLPPRPWCRVPARNAEEDPMPARDGSSPLGA